MTEKQSLRKILLVDDDADDQKYFLEAVAEIDPNIECTTARDGLQALEILRNPLVSLPNFIFLDLRMPRYNGKQCLLQIKGDERLNEIPVIIYTTSREIQESMDILNMGAAHFISKPSNPNEIFYVLSLVLEEQWDKI